VKGIKRFAWWKDGVEYVGTCGLTLEQALKEVDEELE
jgi:exonuclease VII small subunit